jgi:hypothetical protein
MAMYGLGIFMSVAVFFISGLYTLFIWNTSNKYKKFWVMAPIISFALLILFIVLAVKSKFTNIKEKENKG